MDFPAKQSLIVSPVTHSRFFGDMLDLLFKRTYWIIMGLMLIPNKEINYSSPNSQGLILHDILNPDSNFHSDAPFSRRFQNVSPEPQL